MKKWVKIVLCVLLALLLLAGGYVAYVFIDYHRIGDQMLTPVQSTDAARSVDTIRPIRSFPGTSVSVPTRTTTAFSWTAARSPAPGQKSA